MTATLVGDGERVYAELVNATALVVRLNANNPTIDKTLTAAGLTEVSGPGYSAKTLNASTGTVNNRSGATPAHVVWSPQVFTASGVWGTVYSVSIHRSSDNKLMHIEPVAGNPNIQTSGSTIAYTPKISPQ